MNNLTYGYKFKIKIFSNLRLQNFIESTLNAPRQ